MVIKGKEKLAASVDGRVESVTLLLAALFLSFVLVQQCLADDG